MQQTNDEDIIKCIHCNSARDLSVYKYCPNCGGKELWQSKSVYNKNKADKIRDSIFKWVGDSVFRVWLVVFIGIPLMVSLILELLGFIFGFEIKFK